MERGNKQIVIQEIKMCNKYMQSAINSHPILVKYIPERGKVRLGETNQCFLLFISRGKHM